MLLCVTCARTPDVGAAAMFQSGGVEQKQEHDARVRYERLFPIRSADATRQFGIERALVYVDDIAKVRDRPRTVAAMKNILNYGTWIEDGKVQNVLYGELFPSLLKELYGTQSVSVEAHDRMMRAYETYDRMMNMVAESKGVCPVRYEGDVESALRRLRMPDAWVLAAPDKTTIETIDQRYPLGVNQALRDLTLVMETAEQTGWTGKATTLASGVIKYSHLVAPKLRARPYNALRVLVRYHPHGATHEDVTTALGMLKEFSDRLEILRTPGMFSESWPW